MFPNDLDRKGSMKAIATFDEFAMAAEKGIFIFQGGRFIWPGVKVGYRHPVFGDNELPQMYLETLSLRPLIFSLGQVLTPEDCQDLIETAKPTMLSSQRNAEERKNVYEALPQITQKFRTSSQTFLKDNEFEKFPNSSVMKVRKVSEIVSKITSQHHEFTQIIHYESSQYYAAHYDFFHPTVIADPKMQQKYGLDGGRGNRLATILYYLSDVDEGGETNFPHVGGFKPDFVKNSTLCAVGLKISPNAGTAILFYNMLPNGQFDITSVHGGCAVMKGEKWALNKWIWTNDKTS